MLEINAAGLPLSWGPRADNEVEFSGGDWIDELRHKLWTIAAIAVDKNNNIAFRRKGLNTCRTCAPIPARRGHHARARVTRAFGCAVSAAVIDYDHFVRHSGCETFAHHACNWFLFVQRRDNDRDEHNGKRRVCAYDLASCK